MVISSASPALNIQNWLDGKPGFSYEDWKQSVKLGATSTQATQGRQCNASIEAAISDWRGLNEPIQISPLNVLAKLIVA